MKRMMALFCVCAAACAHATDSTAFGILAVPSSQSETIVAVPWLEPTTNDTPIAVSNLVLTSNLTAGDTLRVYFSSAQQYACWTLGNDGLWQMTTTVTASEVSSKTTATPIDRGNAFILTRQNPNKGPIYVMGKPSTASKTLALKQGWTLIAPPYATNACVNALKWTGVSGSTDSLVIPLSGGGFTTLTWRNSLKKWAKWTGSTWETDYSIPAGTGAWYLNGGANDDTVEFP